MKSLIAIVSSLMALAGAAGAADIPRETKDFVDKVTVANKFEIDTSKLAQEYGKNEEVKRFADQMIADHEKAGQDFKTALKEAGVEAPAGGLDVAHTAKYAKLRLLTTEKGFDAAYVKVQLSAHEEAVALFKSYSTNGPTPALKTFASNTLPTLEHHLTMNKGINQTLSQGDAATGSSSGNSGNQ